MSQERFGEATRRAFLGTATVATAATLTAPIEAKLKLPIQIIPSAQLNWRRRMRMFPHS